MKFWQYARLCRIAYKKNNRILEELEKLGYTDVKIIEEGFLKCYIIKFGFWQYVIFKGTDHWKEVVMDATLFPTEEEVGKVHLGIWYGATKLQNKIKLYIDPMLSTVFIGHSLGAALAWYVSDMFFLQGFEKIVEVVGFGVPKLGNKNYKKFMATENFKKIKFQNNFDIICNLPSFFNDCYSKLYYINYKNKIIENPSKFLILEEKIKMIFSFRFRELIKDHKIQSYFDILRELRL